MIQTHERDHPGHWSVAECIFVQWYNTCIIETDNFSTSRQYSTGFSNPAQLQWWLTVLYNIPESRCSQTATCADFELQPQIRKKKFVKLPIHTLPYRDDNFDIGQHGAFDNGCITHSCHHNRHKLRLSTNVDRNSTYQSSGSGSNNSYLLLFRGHRMTAAGIESLPAQRTPLQGHLPRPRQPPYRYELVCGVDPWLRDTYYFIFLIDNFVQLLRSVIIIKKLRSVTEKSSTTRNIFTSWGSNREEGAERADGWAGGGYASIVIYLFSILLVSAFLLLGLHMLYLSAESDVVAWGLRLFPKPLYILFYLYEVHWSL